MPLLPVKCPMCGAILHIESKKEAAVCQSCGNAFVVEKAINNYNTYNSVVNNITSDSVVVQMESEKERLNTNAETYIKLGKIQKALSIYNELVEKYPNDWRGWWGSIYYDYGYKNVRDLYSAQRRAELSQKMTLFEKVAPPEEYAKLAEVIKTRIDEITVIIEKDKLDELARLNALVDNAIISHAEQIEELTIKLSEASSNYNRAQSELKQAVKERESIEANEQHLKEYKKNIEFLPNLGVLAVVIFGILGLIDGTQFSMVLVVCGFLCAVAYFVLGLLSDVLTAVLIHFPVEELNNAREKERVIRKSTDNLNSIITKLEAELKQYKLRSDYMKLNKGSLVASMKAANVWFGKPQDICHFVDKNMQANK